MLRTVLIADEDAAFRKYLAMPLAAQGFTIYEAADGSAAWQLAVQNRPWMILADISMPEVDGFEFCRRVRSHPLLARHAAPLHLRLRQVQGALPRAADRRRRLPVEEHADPRAPHADPAPHDAVLGPLRDRRGPGGDDRCGGSLPGPHRGVRRPGAPPDVCPGPAHWPLHGARRGRREHRHGHGLPRGRHHLRDRRAGRTAPTASTPSLRGRRAASSSPRATPAPGEPLAQSVEHLLLEGCRLLDESLKDEGGGSAFA